MLNFNDPETFWLNVTNIALGVVTVVCFAAVAGVVFREIVARLRARAVVMVEKDDHAFVMPELGLTMADGGERLDSAENPAPVKPPVKQERIDNDPPNIIRSEN